MRKQIITASGLLLAIAVAGCNPVGMDDTRIWVTGTIYVDPSFTQPAEDIGIVIEGTQESYVTVTDALGMFMIEIQLYSEGGADPSDGESRLDATPGSATFIVTAYNGSSEYKYGGGNQFTVFGGDTLSLYTIDLLDFTEDE